MTQLIETKTPARSPLDATERAELAKLRVEHKELRQGIEKVLGFHKNLRVELALPDAKIDAFGTVIGYEAHSGIDNKGGDILHYIDFKNDMNLEGRIARAEGKVQEKLKRHRRRLGFLVIDAMGHSYAASIEATIILNSILPALQGELSYYGKVTPDLLKHVADALGRNDSDYRPSTILYGDVTHVPEEDKAILRIQRRGHPAPLVWRHATKSLDRALIDKWRETGQEPVGIKLEKEPSRSNIEKANLYKGDIVIPHSDGAREYENFEGHLEESLGKNYTLPAAEITQSLIEGWLGKEQHDDLTLGIIKYSG